MGTPRRRCAAWFAGASDEVRERITRGTFDELFRVPAQTPRQASV